MRLFYIFFLLSLLCTSALSVSSIRQICNDSNSTPLKKVNSLDDLRTAVCRITSTKGNSEQATQLGQRIFDIITKLKQNSNAEKNWRENQELDLAMRLFADRLSSKESLDTNDPKVPLRQSLRTLAAKYGTWEQRQADGAGYFKNLKEALLHTSEGKRLHACFSGPEKNGIKPGVIFEAVDPNNPNARPQKPPLGYGGTMSFAVVPDETNSKKLVRGLEFDYGMSPTNALLGLIHEFQHSCNVHQHSQCSVDPPNKEFSDSCDHESLIDEARAYKVEAQMYKELAQASPKLMCSQIVVSQSYGKTPVSIYDFIASYDEKIESGDFFSHLIPVYVESGQYQSNKAFYENSNATNSKTKFRSDFVEKVRKAGFKINNP